MVLALDFTRARRIWLGEVGYVENGVCEGQK